ncbi:hypothetical protein MNBD_GAMMA26-1573 [hydrothermal vent metagenome]|uniref:L,D-TPase catalytic domain-containing protein n=1 Tax=hydrothermal vent metagenome TaxID=652676 RepID=A0A3B1AP02_9ZZZZ
MYNIDVKRLVKDGTLTYTSSTKNISTKCYWDQAKKIPADTYGGCSATTMTRKKNSKGQPREAIFIPNVKGFSGIFIHMGKPPYESWSDGCIVIDEDKMLEIYDDISPKDGKNVKVVISG